MRSFTLLTLTAATLAAATLAAAALAAPRLLPDAAAAPAPQIGGQMPEFDALKWYNTVPLQVSDLQHKAVLIEVFRTW